MPELIAEPLNAVGEELSDWLELTPLDPAYRAYYPDGSTLDVRTDTLRMAAEISPWSLLTLKRQLYADALGSLDEAATTAEARMMESFGSPDFKEGVAALTEKRLPNFGSLS